MNNQLTQQEKIDILHQEFQSSGFVDNGKLDIPAFYRTLDQKAKKQVNREVFDQLFEQIERNTSESSLNEFIRIFLLAEDTLAYKIESCKQQLTDLNKQKYELNIRVKTFSKDNQNNTLNLNLVSLTTKPNIKHSLQITVNNIEICNISINQPSINIPNSIFVTNLNDIIKFSLDNKILSYTITELTNMSNPINLNFGTDLTLNINVQLQKTNAQSIAIQSQQVVLEIANTEEELNEYSKDLDCLFEPFPILRKRLKPDRYSSFITPQTGQQQQQTLLQPRQEEAKPYSEQLMSKFSIDPYANQPKIVQPQVEEYQQDQQQQCQIMPESPRSKELLISKILFGMCVFLECIEFAISLQRAVFLDQMIFAFFVYFYKTNQMTSSFFKYMLMTLVFSLLLDFIWIIDFSSNYFSSGGIYTASAFFSWLNTIVKLGVLPLTIGLKTSSQQ